MQGSIVKIYLDVCCLCRPFDDQAHQRIRIETEAVLVILRKCITEWDLVSSEAIEEEIRNISLDERRERAESLLRFAKYRLIITSSIEERARIFHTWGLYPLDALHLACAEEAGAVLLTTDDLLTKIIMRHSDNISVEVKNPVQWLMEVTMDGGKDIE